jgi:hypothetical protein
MGLHLIMGWVQNTGVNQNEPTIRIFIDGDVKAMHSGNTTPFATSAVQRAIQFDFFLANREGAGLINGRYSFLNSRSQLGQVPVILRDIIDNRPMDFTIDQNIEFEVTLPIASPNYAITHEFSWIDHL